MGGVFSRSRKIRCDSTRPNCQNCVKRGNECVYDKVPKRRGPDKRPGTRKRSCKKRQSDGSDPQPKKKRRADPVDQGTTTAYATYNQYEISSVAVPVFGPTHPKTSKIDTEPHTSSFHQAYYVKVRALFSSPSLFEIPPLTVWIPPIRRRGSHHHRPHRRSHHQRHVLQGVKYNKGRRSLIL